MSSRTRMKLRVPGLISFRARIAASGKRERSSLSNAKSNARSFKLQVSRFRDPLYLIPMEQVLRRSISRGFRFLVPGFMFLVLC